MIPKLRKCFTETGALCVLTYGGYVIVDTLLIICVLTVVCMKRVCVCVCEVLWTDRALDPLCAEGAGNYKDADR